MSACVCARKVAEWNAIIADFTPRATTRQDKRHLKMMRDDRDWWAQRLATGHE